MEDSQKPGRSMQALLAFSGASVRRLLTRGRLLFTEDPGQATDRSAEAAFARSLLRSAFDLKGGVAKAAQLSGYLQGDPGALLDPESRRVLAPLFDQVPGGEPEAIRQVVMQDLLHPPEEIFARWEDRPFAAASLGQVHGATSREGVELAVKVQYPGIAAALAADLSNEVVLRKLTGAAMGGAVSSQAQEAVKAAILREVDYRAEAQAMIRFRAAFLGDPHIVVPRCYPELSGERVLSAERLYGQSIAGFAQAGPAVAALAQVAETLLRFGLFAPLVHGILNADPNPGNYLVLADDPHGPRVGFLDFGCAVELPEDVVTCERVLWSSLLAGDGETLRYALYREGLVSEMAELDSDRYRAWERILLLPFETHRFTADAEYARQLVEHTSLLVRGRRFTLPAASILLWRQRLGLWAVIGQLGAPADFRGVLMALLQKVDMLPAGTK